MAPNAVVEPPKDVAPKPPVDGAAAPKPEAGAAPKPPAAGAAVAPNPPAVAPNPPVPPNVEVLAVGPPNGVEPNPEKAGYSGK